MPAERKSKARKESTAASRDPAAPAVPTPEAKGASKPEAKAASKPEGKSELKSGPKPAPNLTADAIPSNGDAVAPRIVDAEDVTNAAEGEALEEQSPEDQAAGEGLGPPPAKEEKRSRLRWRKKEMPEGLWLKCESCSQMIYRKELEDKGMVCPACDFHFTLPGKERIAMVLDAGTWQERFPELTTLDRLEFKDQVPYSEKVRRTVERTKQNEALICGTGQLDGRPIVLAVLDFGFMGGSMGEVVGEKISLAVDLARVRREPVVIFTSSGGARMHEGMLSLMQMAKTSAALASFNEAGGFSVCVLTHPTTGGVTASFASVCDVTLAEPGALIGFAGPRVIATTLKQELPPGFQRAEFLLEKGQIDAIVKRSNLKNVLGRLIDFGKGAFAV